MTIKFNFPKLALTRPKTPETIHFPADFKSKAELEKLNSSEYVINRGKQDIIRLLSEVEENVFPLYDTKADSRVGTERIAYAKAALPNWKDLHRKLAVLCIKPQSVDRIVSEYEQLTTENRKGAGIHAVNIDTSDYLSVSPYNAKTYNLWSIVDQLPLEIRLSVWGTFPDKWGSDWMTVADGIKEAIREALCDAGGRREFGVEIAQVGLDRLIDQINKNIINASARRKYIAEKDATANVRDYVYRLSDIVNSIIMVPYIIDGLSLKKEQGRALRFVNSFPETFYDELLYLCCADLTAADYPCGNETSKKAHQAYQAKARKVFRWLIDPIRVDKSHLPGLAAAARRYHDDSNEENGTHQNKVALTEFMQRLATLYKNEVDKRLQTQDKLASAMDLAASAPSQLLSDTDDEGIPTVLNTTDWQKKTGKRTFQLGRHTDGEELLAALTAPIIERTGRPLPSAAFEQLLLLLKYSEVDKPIIALLQALPAFTETSLVLLARELRERFANEQYFSKHYLWYVTASIWLPDPRYAADCWAWTKQHQNNMQRRTAIKHSINVLAAIVAQSPDSERVNNALATLVAISNKMRPAIQRYTKAQIDKGIAKLGVPLDTLIDRLTPHFDLDQRGCKVLDYHPQRTDSRKLTLQLTPELKYHFSDDKGKVFKNLPKPRVQEDSTYVNTLIKDTKNELKQLRQLSIDLPKFLQELMIKQRTIPLADFMKYYVEHPVMSLFTQQLLWQIDINDEQQLFRVSESHELLDVNDDLLKPDDLINQAAQVVLVHPITISQDSLKQWSQVFNDYELISPFPQLSRPCYYLNKSEQQHQVINRFNDKNFATGSFIGLASRGWHKHQADAGYCNGYSAEIGGSDFTIEFFEGYSPTGGVPTDDEGQSLEPIKLSADMSEVVISEIIYLFDVMPSV